MMIQPVCVAAECLDRVEGPTAPKLKALRPKKAELKNFGGNKKRAKLLS